VNNTSGVGISGARVTVLDGPNAAAFVDTNSNGEYTFPTLTIGNVNFVATASGFVEDRRGTFVNGTNSLTFTLPREPNPPPVVVPLTITTRIVSGGGGSDAQEWELTATSTAKFESYDWDFGDGASANNGNATEQHIYRKGSYTVTVVARPARGSSVTATKDISVD
jgi:PKD repeat protein